MTDPLRTTMNIAIIGSRTYKNLPNINILLSKLDPGQCTIISGAGKGVDTYAERVAYKLGFDVDTYPPDWNRYGKSAGFKRNHDIIENACKVYAFWDGESKGTLHSIKLAEEKGIPVIIVRDVPLITR